MKKSQIIKDVCEKFPQFASRSLARYVLEEYGGLWEYNLEAIRNAVRYYRGSAGNKNRPYKRYDSSNAAMPKSWNRKMPSYYLTTGRWLVLSDLHIPFHEELPLDAAIKFGKQMKCQHVLLNGDVQDCESWSLWPQIRRRNFMQEASMVVEFFKYLRCHFPKANIVYRPGNHEYRLPRYYARHCPDLINTPLAAMETLLDFETFDIEFLDYYQRLYAGKLPIFHGNEIRNLSGVVNTARGLFLKAKSFALCAHHHRTSEHTEVNIEDRYLTCWSVGCLCNLHPEYNPFGGNWNWGFAMIDIAQNGDFIVHNKRILKHGEIV